MLKTVSSITNAIDALNYKGTWNASTNTPTLASGVGTKGNYYVVSVAGATTLNGISNWGVGDWVAYNGSVWQWVEGGTDLNGVNLSISGTSTLSGLTASTALALDASKNVVSVTNIGTGNNVLQTAPTLLGDVTLSAGNLVIGTAGKGIDFSANSNAAGMTSELFDDYEEGTYTVHLFDALSGGNQSATSVTGYYTKIGRQVTCSFRNLNNISTAGMTAGNTLTFSLPFTVGATVGAGIGSCSTEVFTFDVGTTQINPQAEQNQTRGTFITTGSGIANVFFTVAGITTGVSDIQRFTLTYFTL
jgi:hypothetical protein